MNSKASMYFKQQKNHPGEKKCAINKYVSKSKQQLFIFLIFWPQSWHVEVPWLKDQTDTTTAVWARAVTMPDA